ncbi:hypothetical protein [Arthrobacter roseus]|uniref:hypothetical protein n=1 Tax=Arthrobacter roseus TaxID=136274 RepID=UPI001962B4F8|nr:hypothetical protein [Arthrobacter roseus]MBM7847341.1 hypothetical protein [Arthrobacter roseus]
MIAAWAERNLPATTASTPRTGGEGYDRAEAGGTARTPTAAPSDLASTVHLQRNESVLDETPGKSDIQGRTFV